MFLYACDTARCHKVMEQQEYRFPIILNLNISVQRRDVTRKSDTRTLIKLRTTKTEASLIHKKAFPTVLILYEQQTAAVVPKDL